MTATAATAEIFWTAFKALPKGEQEAIIARLLGDKEFVEDLMDVALIEQARCEPGPDITLHDYTGAKSR
jgi:ABC-type arginine/histidine transport system permease subunit